MKVFHTQCFLLRNDSVVYFQSDSNNSISEQSPPSPHLPTLQPSSKGEEEIFFIKQLLEKFKKLASTLEFASISPPYSLGVRQDYLTGKGKRGREIEMRRLGGIGEANFGPVDRDNKGGEGVHLKTGRKMRRLVEQIC